jgi:hypothetical protein
MRAVFVDATTGRVRTTGEWPTASDRSRIARAPEGRFLVITPDRLLLCSLDLQVLRELDLSLSREAMLASFQAHVSPAGNYLLIEYELPGGDEDRYKWIDVRGLQLLRTGSSRAWRFTGSPSDDGQVISGMNAPVIGPPGGPSRPLCAPFHSDCGGWFVDGEDLFQQYPTGEGRTRIHLMRVGGEFLFDFDLAPKEVLRGDAAAPDARRLAIAIAKGKGGSRALDIAPHYSLDRITVYDVTTRQWIHTLDAKGQGIASISEFALSPDGLLLGLIDQDGVLRVYRLPQTTVGSHR